MAFTPTPRGRTLGSVIRILQDVVVPKGTFHAQSDLTVIAVPLDNYDEFRYRDNDSKETLMFNPALVDHEVILEGR